MLKQSSFACWPAAGGLDDQNADLVDDVIRWFRLMRRMEYEYKAGEWEGPGDEHRSGYNPLDGRLQ